MKYTTELTKKLGDLFIEHQDIDIVLDKFNVGLEEPIGRRSIIAKLSSMGLYKRKEYVNKRGEVPIKKGEYIDRIAALLDVNSDILESLEKVNKGVLALLESKLELVRE